MIRKIAMAAGAAVLLLSATSAALAEKPVALDRSQRLKCLGENCEVVPYEDAVKLQSTLLPPAVEEAFKNGYGTLRMTKETTAKSIERDFCGAGLYDKANRLVVTSHHCLPDYIELLGGGRVLFRGVAVEYIASIPEADMALFQIESIPAGMEELRITEGVVGETVYGRSMQIIKIADTAQGKTLPHDIFLDVPISFEGTVAAKGGVLVRIAMPKKDGEGVSLKTPPPEYQFLRINGEVDAGFSGGPLYNEWGEVVAIVTSGGDGKTYASSSRNIPLLLALAKENKYKKN